MMQPTPKARIQAAFRLSVIRRYYTVSLSQPSSSEYISVQGVRLQFHSPSLFGRLIGP